MGSRYPGRGRRTIASALLVEGGNGEQSGAPSTESEGYVDALLKMVARENCRGERGERPGARRRKPL